MLPNSNVKGPEVRAIFDTTAAACCEACAADSNWCALAETPCSLAGMHAEWVCGMSEVGGAQHHAV